MQHDKQEHSRREHGREEHCRKRKMKPLAEMNLLDNFLFTQMVTSPQYGERFAKILIQTLMQKDISKFICRPQNVYPGANSDLHATRMDVIIEEEESSDTKQAEVFDIEPEKDSRPESVASLPRRTRFYHAKIDARSLQAGAKYSSLKNAYVIMITPFDPFGKGLMLYTAESVIKEDLSIPYDDGAKTLYFYTKGRSEEISDSIRQLLTYMEHTSSENAANPDLQEIDRMVNYIKHEERVEDLYMKSFEIDEMIREEGREEGRKEGRREERQNTERERQRADAAEDRANAAEGRADAAERKILELTKQLAALRVSEP